MIPRNVFYDRRDNHCAACPWWQGVCRKGHKLSSPMGCPLKKFPPVQNADYMEDRPVAPGAVARGGCRGCADPPPVPLKLNFTGVLQHFARAMAEWTKAGMPLLDAQDHAARYGTCRTCPHYAMYQCELCQCIAYVKAKVATEDCPAGKWPSREGS